MGGFCCQGISDTDQQISFDNKPQIIYPNSREICNRSYENSLSEFNKKINDYGDYISNDDFISMIPEEIQKYMKEKPLNINQEKQNKSTFEIKPFKFKNNENIYQGKWNKICNLMVEENIF